MAMIRRADIEGAPRQALVMDLGDLRARGETLIREATAKAEEIIREAKAERERLLATARSEGYRTGHAEGLAKGHAEGLERGVEEARTAKREEIESVTAPWAAALEAFESAREAMIQAARTEVVCLAAEIAARVTRRCVELDAAAVLPQMEAVLSAVARPSRLTLRVHPADLALARAELPDLIARFDLCRHAELVPDSGLERGSCVASTDDGGRIDAGFEAQLDRIISALLPEGRSIPIARARGDAA